MSCESQVLIEEIIEVSQGEKATEIKDSLG